MDKQKVYLETSLISYLTSKPSRDLVAAAHQQISHHWWDTQRSNFEIYVSQLVYEEASKGNQEASNKRLKLLANLTILELNENAYNLANDFVLRNMIPTKFIEDAFHISIATVHGMDYLLTWNCKHIANASIQHKIEEVCREHGFINPIICTPEELMGE